MLFESVIEYLNHFRVNIILCFVSIFCNMNMNRLMIIRIELEDKSKYDEYCRHRSKRLSAKVKLFI